MANRVVLCVSLLSFATILMPALARAEWVLDFEESAYIDGLPAYDWYHGCAPTAAGMLMGYWDLNGFPDLFDASGAGVYLTANVKDQISSPEHNAKYDPTPDDPYLPDPPYTSIADFFHTSQDPLEYGESYGDLADDAVSGYAEYRGYTFNARLLDETWGFFLGPAEWQLEIGEGRPVWLGVDTDKDRYGDHAVAAFGYYYRWLSDEDTNRWRLEQGFACYDTWSESEEDVRWETVWQEGRLDPWELPDSSGGSGWDPTLACTCEPVPEPTTLWLLALGSLAVMPRRRR